jgi:hypothetical protein
MKGLFRRARRRRWRMRVHPNTLGRAHWPWWKSVSTNTATPEKLRETLRNLYAECTPGGTVKFHGVTLFRDGEFFAGPFFYNE